MAHPDESRFDALNQRIAAAARKHDRPPAIAQAIRPDYAHWAQSYYALLTLFLSRGYAIKPDGDYTPGPEKTLYLRHDVHWRDIPGALAMMDMERKLGVRSTYYIMWEYRKWDRDHRDDYLLLKKFGGEDFEYGLHECVFDEHLFRTYLDGRDDAREARRHTAEILAEAGVALLDPASMFEADEHGVYYLKSVESLPTERLRNWFNGAREILAERIVSFREAFGPSRVIHSHGGYAWSEFRTHLGLPGDYHFFRAFHDLPKPHAVMLGQPFRAFSPAWLKSQGVESFVYPRIHREKNRQPLVADYHDGGDQSADELLHQLTPALNAGEKVFINLHAWLWTKGHYNALARRVLESFPTRQSQPAPGPSLYGLYRTAQALHADARMGREFGEGWPEKEPARVTFGYTIGNYDDRGDRLIASINHYGRRDLLDGSAIIDLGGGAGAISSYLATHHPLRHVRLMDIDPCSLAFQRNIIREMHWEDCRIAEESSFATWQAPDDTVDLVMSYGAFEFMSSNRDIRHIFTQVGKALKPGGVFVVNVWNHHYKYQGYSRAPYVQYLPTQPLRLLAARMMGKKPNPYFRSLSHKRWTRELTRAGLGQIRFLYCQTTKDGYRFTDVQSANRSKLSHVWILATMLP